MCVGINGGGVVSGSSRCPTPGDGSRPDARAGWTTCWARGRRSAGAGRAALARGRWPSAGRPQILRSRTQLGTLFVIRQRLADTITVRWTRYLTTLQNKRASRWNRKAFLPRSAGRSGTSPRRRRRCVRDADGRATSLTVAFARVRARARARSFAVPVSFASSTHCIGVCAEVNHYVCYVRLALSRRRGGARVLAAVTWPNESGSRGCYPRPRPRAPSIDRRSAATPQRRRSAAPERPNDGTAQRRNAARRPIAQLIHPVVPDVATVAPYDFRPK